MRGRQAHWMKEEPPRIYAGECQHRTLTFPCSLARRKFLPSAQPCNARSCLLALDLFSATLTIARHATGILLFLDLETATLAGKGYFLLLHRSRISRDLFASRDRDHAARALAGRLSDVTFSCLPS